MEEEEEDGCAECGSCATRLCDCDNILQAGAMIMQTIDGTLGLHVSICELKRGKTWLSVNDELTFLRTDGHSE